MQRVLRLFPTSLLGPTSASSPLRLGIGGVRFSMSRALVQPATEEALTKELMRRHR